MRRTFGAVLMALALGCAGGMPVEGEFAEDEAGLWMVANKAEHEVRTSGRLVRDERLTRYVQAIACELDPDLCEGIRSYVIDQPYWNASMSPNGMMQVWTGLLLRAQNEAQLAAVIGHEMVHHRDRHLLQRFRSVKQATAAHMMLAVATSGLSAIVTAPLAMGSLSAFSRDHEREADRGGLEMMARAGYDPREAAKIWKNLLEEDEAIDDDSRSLFFASHPSPKQRARTLGLLAEELATEETDGVVHQDRFEMIIGPLRRGLLEGELALREPDGTEVVLNRLAEVPGVLGLVEFYRGELYRLRHDDGDEERALEHYRRAIAAADAPAEAHRSLGLMLRRMGDEAGAWQQLSLYLERTPDASDASMIESYLEDLQ